MTDFSARSNALQADVAKVGVAETHAPVLRDAVLTCPRCGGPFDPEAPHRIAAVLIGLRDDICRGCEDDDIDDYAGV